MQHPQNVTMVCKFTKNVSENAEGARIVGHWHVLEGPVKNSLGKGNVVVVSHVQEILVVEDDVEEFNSVGDVRRMEIVKKD